MDMNPFELIKNMKGIQENVQKMQENLPSIIATGSAGAGMVEVTINGKFVVTSVKISPEIVDPQDISTLEVLVASAFNSASNKVQEKIKDEGMKYAGAFGNMMPQA
ncbi:YbaB/EbfC family nucleoid-associated protein [uncultured Sphaerochaeta sp.]|uniref:YbaB/EbfC family nucleoid-associated protein n=1 Tax=uncultured Sphaerochaeta sp. TaxID=886478 RepID=UPI002A0A9B5C|nr:YbaB/EbfC family nucleoid-associated protein [uncultured Sphaerochaeta sp.]